MNEESRNREEASPNAETPDTANADAPDADAPGAEQARDQSGREAAAERSPGELAQALEQAQAEIDSLKDAALRAQAEAENVRRRSAREVENAHKFALEKFAGQLLPVVDSMEKSVEAVRDYGGRDESFTAVREGIELSQRLMLDTLEKAGIEQVDPMGEPFDPDLHEAVSMFDAPSAEPNSVVDVLQKGYTLNGRLVRPAMVIVARGSQS